MARSPFFCVLLILTLFVFSSRTVTGQDEVKRASPPIVEIELSGSEPLPPGVSSEMGFGSAAGGGGDYFEEAVPEDPYWDLVPDAAEYPTNPDSLLRIGDYAVHDPGSNFRACSYQSAEPPQATLTKPSGQEDIVEVYETLPGCWAYEVGWAYGMELGEYTMVFDHPEGSLHHSWVIDYADTTMVALVDGEDTSKQVRLLMGFEPNETLNLRFYANGLESYTEEGESIPFTFSGGDTDMGGYVASRTVQTDEYGAVLLEISVTRSAPFILESVGFTVDGYKNDTGMAGPRIDYELISASAAEQTDYAVYAPGDFAGNAESLWEDIIFKDTTSPSAQTYETVVSGDYVRLGFTWCADTPQRLQEAVAPLEVQFSINGTPIDAQHIQQVEQGSCRVWSTILQSQVDELQFQLHYTLSEDIFDGTSTYSAGDYFHTVDITFT